MSLCRQNYDSQVEKAVNDQISMEFKASHIYLSMASYFARDSVALPGFRTFFEKSSNEERDHGKKLIDYQNMRGGRVEISSVPAPEIEWKSARYALENALELEREVNKSLLNLHQIAENCNDPQLCDFLEGNFLNEQVESIKQISDMLTMLNRVGNDGLGLYIFDKELGEKMT